MDCSEAQRHLSDIGESGMSGLTVIRDHLEGCAGCRSELTKFNELHSALRSLSDHVLEPPSWLEGSITETVSQKAARLAALRTLERQVRRPQVVTGGALVAAGIAGAIMLRSRRRRRVRWTGNLRQVLAQTT